MRLFGDIYPRWILTRYIPCIGAWGFYRGFYAREEDKALLVNKILQSTTNACLYLTCPFYPLFQQSARFEIALLKPHLAEKNEWAFRELNGSINNRTW